MEERIESVRRVLQINGLCAMQEEFDQFVIANKNIQWTKTERFYNTMTALDVELAEFANEARWFKRWSHNQKPGPNLLEEFIDGVHFFLSIANQKGFHEELFFSQHLIDTIKETDINGELNSIYLEMKLNLAELLQKDKEVFGTTRHKKGFKDAWLRFMIIGMIGFNFTWEDINKAYLEKRKKNQERQSNGY